MAGPLPSRGYENDFVGEVLEDFYCKKCALVARNLTITNCCGESFCYVCIADTRDLGQPCPVCEETAFTTFEQVKNRKRISNLQTYCSMKERGCVWSGTLDQLDTHLDPHLDNCQYVDTKCPLNCLQTIPKNKVDQHVAQECTKRPHVCQHCGFKATYEEVVDTHLPECKYVALQCPNMCGVSCEREVMEDHMKICRLEEVECEFSSVGCDGRFIREDEDEHARQNSQKHLTLTASLAVETKEQLQQKLLEQDKKHKEEEEKLKARIEGLEKQLVEVREVQKAMAKKYEHKLKWLENMLKEVVPKIGRRDSGASATSKFVMNNFSKEKAKNKISDWKSPAMYTHVCGYKFCIGVDANGCGDGRGKSIRVDIWPMAGEFDDQLKWPAKAQFTVELINQQGGENAKCTSEKLTWSKPIKQRFFSESFIVLRIMIGLSGTFIEHSKLNEFLENDALHFLVSKVKCCDV